MCVWKEHKILQTFVWCAGQPVGFGANSGRALGGTRAVAGARARALRCRRPGGREVAGGTELSHAGAVCVHDVDAVGGEEGDSLAVWGPAGSRATTGSEPGQFGAVGVHDVDLAVVARSIGEAPAVG